MLSTALMIKLTDVLSNSFDGFSLSKLNFPIVSILSVSMYSFESKGKTLLLRKLFISISIIFLKQSKC